MEYYKGYLDKEWIRRQLRKHGIELRGKDLTDLCYEIQECMIEEYQVENIIKVETKRYFEKQKQLSIYLEKEKE